MTTLEQAWALSREDHGLAIVSTARADGSVQSTLVNTGLLAHPASGVPVLAFVTYGKIKLGNLRARPRLAVAFRNGWRYATVEGTAELAGPDDAQDWLDPERLRVLLRDIFSAAGGTHDDWDAYDRTMVDERRTAVLIQPQRIYPTL
ncbi:TIGR03618 family F420-dependent PPOX class oxidoreductase [Kineosporia rhizophila]|uniref:TIGR03618 family F420-dependent PPOX class oxidoreductase n=1 Tax=Kineosporia TaxID=49184 RepID=UPI000B0C3E38|nr:MULTISPECIES: TIGR03618 family F420-dependent PPOX class oxidoreductase [Kineosporia]MCE0540329.1 TIGR03618 family F420-dependent PPOX class oxidoreductase [Kineosporia rhizophila]GLY16302.1 PPOX class F420-dependent enzyme [Kineosporia sp. NBRC 101677]